MPFKGPVQGGALVGGRGQSPLKASHLLEFKGMIRTTIDHRERDLIAELGSSTSHSSTMEFDTAALDVGDILFDSPRCRIVVERKTLSDLAASIKDGRYAEQKQRLTAFMRSIGREDILQGEGEEEEEKENRHHRVIVVLLLEGRMRYDDDREERIGGLANKAIVTAAINARFRDGFFVVETQNLKETAAFVRCIAKRLPENGIGWSLSQMNREYVPCVVKTQKRENLDVPTSFVCQLCQIPGVSLKTAHILVKATSAVNMKDLLTKLDAVWPSSDVGEKTMETIGRFLGVSKPRAGVPIETFFPRLNKFHDDDTMMSTIVQVDHHLPTL